MTSLRTTLVILAIRGFAAIGLLILGVFNLLDGETALGVLWIGVALVFGFMAWRRWRALRGTTDATGPGASR